MGHWGRSLPSTLVRKLAAVALPMHRHGNVHANRAAPRTQLRGTRLFPALWAVAVSGFGTTPALAGDDSSTPPATGPGNGSPRLYLSLSAGGSSAGLIGAANLTLGTGAFQLSARASHAAAIEIMCRPEVDLVEYSLMAGYGHREGSMLLYAMAGAGYASVTRNQKRSSNACWSGDYETSHDRTVSFPLQLGVAWEFHVVSIGPTLAANINPAYPEVAILLTVSLGKIR
jgi:hypothetical protein